jgi:hypothetical protein
MAATGRQPYTVTDLAPYGSGSRRLRPPASLGDAERRVFLDLITATPAGQFTAADLPLLCAWAETVALRERMAARMAIEGELDEKGKPSGAFTVHQQATKTLSGLALRLRLGPQSRSSKAPKKIAGPVSYFERMELEGIRDDDGDDSR